MPEGQKGLTLLSLRTQRLCGEFFFLTAPRSTDNDIVNGQKEIPTLGLKRRTKVGLEILLLRRADFIQGLWHVRIKGRQKTWFCFLSKLLKPFGIQGKKVPAQRSDSDQLEISP